MAKSGKRMRSSLERIDRDCLYSIEEAVKIVKDNAKVKFDETVEIAMNLGIDPRHADQQVRGVAGPRRRQAGKVRDRRRRRPAAAGQRQGDRGVRDVVVDARVAGHADGDGRGQDAVEPEPAQAAAERRVQGVDGCGQHGAERVPQQ